MNLGRTFHAVMLLYCLFIAEPVLSAERPAGRVVWWGHDPGPFYKGMYQPHTNGVLDGEDEILTNVVAIAGGWNQSLALTSDGRVKAFGVDFFGGNNVPPGLSNVASIAVEGSTCWAIRRDGTVVRWGNEPDDRNIVGSLSNITAIAWAGYKSFLALKDDGTLLGFRFDSPEQMYGLPPNTNAVQQVTVAGKVLRDVAAVASIDNSPLIRKRDGTVFRLGFRSPSQSQSEEKELAGAMVMFDVGGALWNVPYRFTSMDPVIVGGGPLSNVTALASGYGHTLALKRDGTVVAWGSNTSGESQVPDGLGHVVAIAAAEQVSLALKRDGTVVAWGADGFGQGSVPADLSNVVSIASAGWFNLALTTGSVPKNVFIQPHGRLEEMAQAADLIFKGETLDDWPTTNAAFQIQAMDVHATTFRVISVLKGELSTNTITFQHYTKEPGVWGGGSPPPHYRFEPSLSYLIFAAKADRAGKLYYDYFPTPYSVGRPDQFRQLGAPAIRADDGAMRTLDNRPLGKLSIKEAHWLELNLLLNDTNRTNQLYAIRHLNLLSTNCATSWEHTEDFHRERVLAALAPLATNANDQVAVAALDCFCFGPDCAEQIVPYADTFIQIADLASTPARRVAAVIAFSRTGLSKITNSLAKWLGDADENVRGRAVLLLPDLPGQPSEQALRRAATDPSARVRASVADAIGNGRMTQLLPTLVALFSDPVGLTSPVPPLTAEDVEAGGRLWHDNGANVHVSAGDALLKFDLDQVGTILKTNLNDAGFRLSFLCRLSEQDAGPWIKDMADALDAWRLREKKRSASWGANPETYLPVLSGTHFQAWKIIYHHLQELPPGSFADGKFDRILEVLESAGTTGSSEPRDLYELYRLKGLNERAEKYRSWCERTFSYDIGLYFKQVDARFPNSTTEHER